MQSTIQLTRTVLVPNFINQNLSEEIYINSTHSYSDVFNIYFLLNSLQFGHITCIPLLAEMYIQWIHVDTKLNQNNIHTSVFIKRLHAFTKVTVLG